MWSQWPWVSSTRRTPRRAHRSRSLSCSLAASRSTASPVSVQRRTKTLLSTGPTTAWWISTPVAAQISVSAAIGPRLLANGPGVARHLEAARVDHLEVGRPDVAERPELVVVPPLVRDAGDEHRGAVVG